MCVNLRLVWISEICFVKCMTNRIFIPYIWLRCIRKCIILLCFLLFVSAIVSVPQNCTCSAMFMLTLWTRRSECQLLHITLTDGLPMSHNEGGKGPPKILPQNSWPQIALCDLAGECLKDLRLYYQWKSWGDHSNKWYQIDNSPSMTPIWDLS